MKTILFVDDQHAVRTVFGEMLRHAGHVVLEAGTLVEAEHLIERERRAIDLLIAEVVLTTTNGLAVARRLEARCPKMRVLFVSARPATNLESEGMLPKGAPFLRKPFTAEDLIGKVRELTETAERVR